MEILMLDLLSKIILNNTKLSYTDDQILRLDDTTAVMEIIKAYYPQDYEERVMELNDRNTRKPF